MDKDSPFQLAVVTKALVDPFTRISTYFVFCCTKKKYAIVYTTARPSNFIKGHTFTLTQIAKFHKA